jgi:hypothetical protein
MTQPTVKLQVSLGGGANVSGYQAAAFSQTCQISATSTAGWSSALWQIYDYPPGFTAPAGWSTDASGVIYYAPTNPTTLPPSFNFPSSANNTWGRFMLRLTVNGNPLALNPDGTPNALYNPLLTDESTILYIPDPTTAAQGIGFNETVQSDSLRAWAGAIMANLRAISAAIATAVLNIFNWTPVAGTNDQEQLHRVTSTTNDTVVVQSYLMAPDSQLWITTLILVHDVASGHLAHAKIFWYGDHWERVNAAAPTRVQAAAGPVDLTGGSMANQADAGMPACSVTIDQDGTATVRIKRVGVAATNLTWLVRTQFLANT